MSKSIVRRFVAIFGSNMIAILAGLLATPIIVRILGRQRYGDYAFVMSVLSILLLFVNAGIYDGIRKYLTESDRPDDWADHVVGFYSRLGFAFAGLTLIGIIGLVEAGIVGTYVGERFEVLFVLIAFTVLTQQAFAIARSALMGCDREDLSEKLMIANRVLALAFGLVLIWFEFGVAGLIAGKLAANVLTAVAGFLVTVRFIDVSYVLSGVPTAFPRRDLLMFNVMSIALFGLYLSIKHVDILLIQAFYGSTQNGYYKAALNLAEFVWFVPRIVQTTLLHSTSELWSEGRNEAISSLSSKVTRYSILFTMLLVIGLAVLAEPTVLLYYGQEFEDAILPLVILLPGAMGFAVARPILAIGQGKGAFRYLIYATGAASVVNLVLNLILIPRFGIAGAAVATSTGYFSMLVFHVASAKAIGFNPIDDLRLPSITMTIVVSTVAIFGLATLIESVPLSLLIVPPTGFVVYSGVAIAVGAVSIDELRQLREEVPV